MIIALLWHKIYSYICKFTKSICLSLIPIKLYSNDIDESFRLVVKEGDSTIADSGTLYDVSIPRGRIGVFAYNQTGVIWSDMRFECKDRWVVFLFLCIIIEIFKVLVKSMKTKIMSYCLQTTKDDWTVMHNHSFFDFKLSLWFFWPRTNKALSLDGSTYGTIGNMTGLRIEKR